MNLIYETLNPKEELEFEEKLWKKNEKKEKGNYIFITWFQKYALSKCVGWRVQGGVLSKHYSNPDFKCLENYNFLIARNCYELQGSWLHNTTLHHFLQKNSRQCWCTHIQNKEDKTNISLKIKGHFVKNKNQRLK